MPTGPTNPDALNDFIGGIVEKIRGGTAPPPPIIFRGFGVSEEQEKEEEKRRTEWEENHGEAWRRQQRDGVVFTGLILGTPNSSPDR